jgi:hypothetical protein
MFSAFDTHTFKRRGIHKNLIPPKKQNANKAFTLQLMNMRFSHIIAFILSKKKHLGVTGINDKNHCTNPTAQYDLLYISCVAYCCTFIEYPETFYVYAFTRNAIDDLALDDLFLSCLQFCLLCVGIAYFEKWFTCFLVSDLRSILFVARCCISDCQDNAK